MPGPITEPMTNSSSALEREETKYKIILLSAIGLSIFIAGIHIGYTKRSVIASFLRHYTCAKTLEGRELSNALMMQANAAMNNKDADKAILHYNQALANDPDTASAHLAIGLLYDKYKTNYVKAIYHYERYLELRPQSEKGEMIQDLTRDARYLYAKECLNISDTNSDRQQSILMAKYLDHIINSYPTPMNLPVKIHIVKEDETLPEISLKYFGHTKEWKRIYKINREQIYDPQQLTPGAYIIIPSTSIGDSPNLNLDVDGCSLSMIWIAPIGLWSAKYEVSNELYGKFKPAKLTLNKMLPVTMVSWHDASSFCNWLNEKYRTTLPDGYAFRLPSEQEWSSLCAAGESNIYPWGNSWPPPDEWNYMGAESTNAKKMIIGHTDAFEKLAPVTACGTNAWGLAGMGGNVWEWCGDWYDTAQQKRVVRGASWFNYSRETLKNSFRSPKSPEIKDDVTGFRIVLGVTI